MDKGRVRKYRRLQQEIEEAQREYTASFLRALNVRTDSDEDILALEESHAVLLGEIEKLKRILARPYDIEENEIEKSDRPMRPAE